MSPLRKIHALGQEYAAMRGIGPAQVWVEAYRGVLLILAFPLLVGIVLAMLGAS